MNSVGTDYFGVDVEALRTSRGDRVHEEDRPAVERAWATAVTRGRPYEVRARLLRGDGEPRWFLTRALPRFDEEGGLTEWYGTNTDVHDHVEAEHGITRALAELSEVLEQRMRERSELERKSRELEQTAMALERANRDLDQFAHVAGHDLRAPLRGIASLADFLRQDLGESLSPQATELLDLLTERVRRMRQMVDGLLAYARVGHFDVEPERVDVEEMVGELSTILTSGGGPEVHLQPGLPVIETLRLPLEHVFQNLLSNAVRFAGAEGGRIDVGGARQPDGQWEFWVADNGPGIAEQLQDKIWGMFQTLTASEGTGIGLAVVKRHVESCGGSIRVESAPGRGARFRFTWPSFPRDEERE
jgi:signal transduction histidine kinase